MADRTRILIVDDDRLVTENLSNYLKNENYNVTLVRDGSKSIQTFKSFQPDCILMDILLPGSDGYQLCREFRLISQVPIIIISAKSEVFDKVLGLEIGADDYLVKPFDNKELTARIKAVLRRYRLTINPLHNQNNHIIKYTGLIINYSNYLVIYRGSALEMPPKELELLYFLASSPNRVFTREQLLDHVWGYEYMGDTRTVDVHIKRIRAKINNYADWKIATVWGIGYKFQVQPKES